MVTDWNCHPIRHRLCFQKPRPLKRREARRRRKEITTNLTSTSYVQINNITSGMQLVICTMIQWKILIAFFLNKGRGLPSTQPLVRSSSSALQVTARPSGFSLKSRSHIHNPSFKSRWKCKKKKKVYSVSSQTAGRQGFLCPAANVPPICEELDRQWEKLSLRMYRWVKLQPNYYDWILG